LRGRGQTSKTLPNFNPPKSEFGLAPELAHTIRIKTDSLGAATCRVARVSDTFLFGAGVHWDEWESDERDFATET
jgi:hypothetical protein